MGDLWEIHGRPMGDLGTSSPSHCGLRFLGTTSERAASCRVPSAWRAWSRKYGSLLFWEKRLMSIAARSWEMQASYGGDIGEIQARYRGG
jgi:hypothetical protein